MTECNTKLEFLFRGKKRLEADFLGGSLSSDGGVLLLRELTKKGTSYLLKLASEKTHEARGYKFIQAVRYSKEYSRQKVSNFMLCKVTVNSLVVSTCSSDCYLVILHNIINL